MGDRGLAAGFERKLLGSLALGYFLLGGNRSAGQHKDYCGTTFPLVHVNSSMKNRHEAGA
jgi:hypothetical protein